MSLDSRLCKMRYLFERNTDSIFQLVRKCAQSTAKNYSGFDLLRILRSYKLGRFDRVFIRHKLKKQKLCYTILVSVLLPKANFLSCKECLVLAVHATIR